MITTLAIGGLLILTAILYAIYCALMDRDRTRRPVFPGELTEPAPGLCGCGAPKCTPPDEPLPGEETVFLPAPVAATEPEPEPDDDTIWGRYRIERGQTWARANAEAGAR